MTADTSAIKVIPATVADSPLVAGLIATAFCDLAVARWQIPDEHLRQSVLPAMFQNYLYDALEHGTVEITADMTAAAVWTEATGAVKPTPAAPAGRLAAALGEAAEKVHAVDLAMHRREPVGERFEKLALLAVRPGHQGRGLGSALLSHHLSGLDLRAIPAYLEAADKTSRQLYLRFGFRDYGEPIKVSHGPLMYPMMRKPTRP